MKILRYGSNICYSLVVGIFCWMIILSLLILYNIIQTHQEAWDVEQFLRGSGLIRYVISLGHMSILQLKSSIQLW
jgi:hypothetical protein